MTGGRLAFVSIIGLVLVLLASGCTQDGTSGIYQKIDPFNMTLSFSEHPRFNEPTELIITIRPLLNVSETRALVMAYGGVELTGEYKLEHGFAWLNWNATVQEGEEFSYALPLKLTKLGDYSIGIEIEGMAPDSKTNRLSKIDNWPRAIYFRVTAQEVILSNAPLYSGPMCTGSLEQVEECMRTGVRRTA